MTNEEAVEIRAAAVQLAASIEADIRNAQTRIEHIRLTQLAEEAQRLVTAIDKTGQTVVE